MQCSNCLENAASCTLTVHDGGPTMMLCRACWQALKRKIDAAGLSDLCDDQTGSGDLYAVCDCGCGTWYLRADVEGYVTAHECEACGRVECVYQTPDADTDED